MTEQCVFIIVLSIARVISPRVGGEKDIQKMTAGYDFRYAYILYYTFVDDVTPAFAVW
jgi:hypothetical protein